MINVLELPVNHYVVIGSMALGTRIAKDIDIICYKHDVLVKMDNSDDYIGSFYFEGRRVECLFADKQESLEIILNFSEKSRIADLIELYVIKAGHIFVPGRFWEKHITDYAILRQYVDGNYPITGQLTRFDNRSVNEMIKLHRKCTKERLNLRRTPKLKNVGKEAFFNDNVVKFIDHDEIHKWMAHKDYPMYSYMQREGSDVECDPELWKMFSFKEKVQCVLEEAYVIASERILIPKLMKPAPERTHVNPQKYNHEDVRKAVHWAIMRICTTLCSGWFRQFAVDNHFHIMNSIDYDYHLKIQADQLDPNYGLQNRM